MDAEGGDDEECSSDDGEHVADHGEPVTPAEVDADISGRVVRAAE